MANDSKSDKFKNAVTRATGEPAADGSNAPTIRTPEMSAMVSQVSKEDLAAIINDSSLEFAPQILKLEEGDMVHGVLEGNGPTAEFQNLNPLTKEVTTSQVQTWIIASIGGGQRVSILSSAQLDRKLAPFVGGEVKIVRGKDINTNNGQRVTEYLVAGPKLANGQRRSWATKPVLDVGEVPAQLAAGANSQHEDQTQPRA